MKKIFVSVALILIFTNCMGRYSGESGKVQIHATNVSGQKLSENVTEAYFRLINNRFDFGKINREKNPDITIDVEFYNIGKKPLVILKADVSCGCLAVEYPREPIPPNQSGKLTIRVDTRTQKGAFNKTIYIKTNAENDVELIRILGSINNHY